MFRITHNLYGVFFIQFNDDYDHRGSSSSITMTLIEYLYLSFGFCFPEWTQSSLKLRGLLFKCQSCFNNDYTNYVNLLLNSNRNTMYDELPIIACWLFFPCFQFSFLYFLSHFSFFFNGVIQEVCLPSWFSFASFVILALLRLLLNSMVVDWSDFSQWLA